MRKYISSADKGFCVLILLCGLVLLVGVFIYAGQRRYAGNSKIIQARQAVVRTLRIASLALSYECTATRNPLEGLCSSMSDIPGSYLYHTDCDLLSPSFFPPEVRYRLEVRRQ